MHPRSPTPAPPSRGGFRGALGSAPRPILALALVLAAVLALRAVVGVEEAGAAVHPDPRPGITAAGVVPAARYARRPDIAGVYEEVREIPRVLDGLYCYCDCSKHAGHRSLLTCFESDHAAGCDICLREAHLARAMVDEGAGLPEIRRAIDATFSPRADP